MLTTGHDPCVNWRDIAISPVIRLVVRRGVIASYLRRTKSELYMRMALIGEGAQYPGAEVVGQWYTRNLRIYVNLRRIIQEPNERVLVLFGQGHAHLLQQYVSDSGDLVLDQLDQLK